MATYYNENTIIYLNGAYVKASEAKMDFYSQSLHYGYSVFEGIRSYKTINGQTRIFKALEHFNRLKVSAEALNATNPSNNISTGMLACLDMIWCSGTRCR